MISSQIRSRAKARQVSDNQIADESDSHPRQQHGKSVNLKPELRKRDSEVDIDKVLGVGSGAFKLQLTNEALGGSGCKLRSIPMDKRDRFGKDFELLEKIGEGTFGEAFKVRVKNE